MASTPLPNYLRTHRKRLALSQEDVAFLLGAVSGAKVSRYEQFLREPGLSTALALEAIFQRPASELFAGVYRQIEKQVAARAKTLLYRVERGKPKRQTQQRRQGLLAIATLPAKQFLQ